MNRQPRFNALASPLRGLFIAAQDMLATARRGENRSKSYFILGIRRKKFPNSNPKAKSAPTLYFSRNFPLFPAISRFQTHPSNIIAEICTAATAGRAFRGGGKKSGPITLPNAFAVSANPFIFSENFAGILSRKRPVFHGAQFPSTIAGIENYTNTRGAARARVPSVCPPSRTPDFPPEFP